MYAPSYKSYHKMAEGLKTGGVDYLINGSIIGTSETFMERIDFIQEKIAIDGLLMQIDTGSASFSSMEETIELASSSIKRGE